MRKPKRRGREGYGAEFWTEQLAAWRASTQSMSAFCAARGITRSALHAWRTRLDRASPRPSGGAAPSRPLLAPVTVVAGAARGDWAIELALPSGVQLRARADVTPAVLGALLAAVQAAC